VGIPATEQALVTEPLHRAWNVRESRVGHRARSLHLPTLVEAHGGRLWLEDRPDGRPERVTFTLPLLRGRRQTAAQPAARAIATPAEVDRG
jgi:signal transduction histidine kinase